MQVRTPDVTIQVNAEHGDLVQTRVIDGVKYILIRAGENVTGKRHRHTYFVTGKRVDCKKHFDKTEGGLL